jgi:putative redox protein
MAGPVTTLNLTWTGDLTFAAQTAKTAFTLDGHSTAGPSPVDALAGGLAGCMSVDVVDILRKGRHPITALATRLMAQRAAETPRRFEAVTLHFVVGGDVPAEAIERAIQLSRDKYCSVWHTLRQDIAFTTTYEVIP